MNIKQVELWRRDDAGISVPPALDIEPHGIWVCELATQRLRWTAGVFDLFGLAPATRLDRRAIVEMYCDQSREEMEWLRAEGIARRTGFSLEAEIQRPDGTRRWMQLTTRIHCRDGRPTHIYGRKRDITEMHLARLSKARLTA